MVRKGEVWRMGERAQSVSGAFTEVRYRETDAKVARTWDIRRFSSMDTRYRFTVERNPAEHKSSFLTRDLADEKSQRMDSFIFPSEKQARLSALLKVMTISLIIILPASIPSVLIAQIHSWQSSSSSPAPA